ncbi:MAG: hypothetical protein ACJA13_003445 [Paraglaciecola sp.]
MKDAKEHSFNIAEEDFPYSGSKEQQLRFLLGYAVLAPSNHNTQPWKFRIHDDSVDVIVDKSSALNFIDPQLRQLTVSCGAAIGMFEVAAKYFGYTPSVRIFEDDSDTIANITLGQKNAEDAHNIRLFKAILQRQTNRRFFATTPVAEPVLKTCKDLAADTGVEFSYISEQEDKVRVANLSEVAIRYQHGQLWYRREFASRLRSNTSGKTGMSSFGFSGLNLPTPVVRFIMELFNTGRSSALFNRRKILKGSPAIGIFLTEQDEQISWLNTGRGLSAVLLELSSQGLTTSYLNQAIEVDNLRPQLARIVRSRGFPQLMIRIGRAPRVKPSQRRSIDDVLLN